MIDQLPSNSRTNEAILNDPDMAAEILKQEELAAASDEPQEGPHPRLSEFGLGEQLLAAIYDGIGALQATTVAAAGGKPRKPKPFTRPRTAVDRLRSQKSREGQQQILSLFGSK